MKAIVFIFAIAASTACATAPRSVATFAGGIATFGQSTRVSALSVTPLAVVEDSRCPINARCIWAGRLILRTRIEGAGWRETVNLTLGNPYSTHSQSLALVSAEPGKMAGSPPSPPASLFAFETR